MATRRFQQLAGIAIGITAVGWGTAVPAHAEGRRLVMPGESIQRAVDAAEPGDTVLVMPGTYRESVQVGVPDLTLRGAGPGTVITPPAVTAGSACARAGDGICVTGAAGDPVADVRIESLTVSGFAKYGIAASGTDRLTVRHVVAEDNGQYGISQEKSTGSRLIGNRAVGNGQAGIFLANFIAAEGGALDTEDAVISGNTLTGNRIGVVVRRARNLTVDHNVMSGNCGGVFVVGDEGHPRAGALSVRHNTVVANNRYCAANSRLPYIQGTGIVLTGVEDTVVAHNTVTDNVGASPLSGGIVLFPSFSGGPDTDNTIEDNTAVRNGPADLADRDTGTNSFAGNACRVSQPLGHC